MPCCFLFGISLPWRWPCFHCLPPARARRLNLLPAISNPRLLTLNSGYIFDGTVLSVQAAPSEANDVATVQITFRVEQAIRGNACRADIDHSGVGRIVELWRTLSPGERLLLFLYSPSSLGLTSPVGGRAGRFAVDSGGNAVIEDGRLPALRSIPLHEPSCAKGAG